MRYSIIVAVFNRPDEMDELLESLTHQSYTDFDVVVVEDGSTVDSKDVCDRYSDRLSICYYAKTNSGPGPSRNYGCDRAEGEFFIFLDSDCMVPEGYMAAIDAGRLAGGLDAFGGPDREHPAFSPIQKAISYAMTSLFTTGGIRGSKVRTGGAFHPRSFNMGLSREVYDTTKGFVPMRFGEDVEFSIRMINHGFRVGLIPDGWVFHKRRTDFKKFFKQVHNSGIARINITVRHSSTLKVTHFFPASFLTYILIASGYAIAVPNGVWAFIPLAIWAMVIFLDATARMRSVGIGALSVVAAFVQMVGYGSGFVRGLITRVILNRPEHGAFEETFYE